MKPYVPWFEQLNGFAPRSWQVELATEEALRSRYLRIPTGYGKTLGVLSAWLYHRVQRRDPRWPRRLVWALPMRVLVEQTAEVARELVAKLEHITDGTPPRQPGSRSPRIGVHLLMGGIDPSGDWNLHPESDAILIGTQDMLLSRALNRGYAAPRARWPMEFGLLNQDALWVLDEVQLMDVGLATSAQLQAYIDQDTAREARPRVSWWMSATVQPDWLRTIDTAPYHSTWITNPAELPPDDRRSGLAAIEKSLELAEIGRDKDRDFAKLCVEAHTALEDGEHGRITLVVCNTVDRAVRAHTEIARLARGTQVELVHGRFRPYERQQWMERFLRRSACCRGADRILVATQVIEAGVDLSAGCLVSELAPWSSLVQRFGRCARYGGRGRVIVVDRLLDEKQAAPYSVAENLAATDALSRLIASGSGVGIADLLAFETALSSEERSALYPYDPPHLLTRRDYEELFDTTPDLSGADLDISRYLRTGEERDLSVFWLEVAPARRGEPPSAPPLDYRPRREELCNIPCARAQEWLCGPNKAARTARKRAWIWDWIDGTWKPVERDALTPGKIVCVAAEDGGYDLARGFDPRAKGPVPPVPPVADPTAQEIADELEDSEALSATSWKSIATHGREVGEEAMRIAVRLELDQRLARILRLAGRWHDLGKAHPAFQASIGGEDRPEREDLAKAPPSTWKRGTQLYRTAGGDHRRGFRHELASCLALFDLLAHYEPEHEALLGPWTAVLPLLGYDEPPRPRADRTKASELEREILDLGAEDFDLLAYLVLAHHGKVRVALHAGPKDQDYRDRDGRGLPIRGVREGDRLPAIELEDGAALPELTLSLAPAALGLSPTTGRSWRERTLALTKRFGPARLAWLEALLIAADRRASKLTTPDPRIVPTEATR